MGIKLQVALCAVLSASACSTAQEQLTKDIVVTAGSSGTGGSSGAGTGGLGSGGNAEPGEGAGVTTQAPVVVTAMCTTDVKAHGITYLWAEAHFPGRAAEELAAVRAVATPSSVTAAQLPRGYTSVQIGYLAFRDEMVAGYCGSATAPTADRYRFTLD